MSGKVLPVHINIDEKRPPRSVCFAEYPHMQRLLQAIVSTSCQILLDAVFTLRCAMVQAECCKQKLEPAAGPSQPHGQPLVYSLLSLLTGFVLLCPSMSDVQLSAIGKHSDSVHLASRIALLLAALISVQATAMRRIWRVQPAGRHLHPPNTSSSAGRPQIGRRAGKKACDQQQPKQSDPTVLIAAGKVMKAKVEAAVKVLQACQGAADSRGAQLAAEQAVSMVLPIEVDAACLLGKEQFSLLDEEASVQASLLRAAAALEVLMTKVHSSRRSDAVSALALTCSHTALPQPLRRSIGPGGRAPCAGPACDGCAYGMPMLLAELSQLCSVAAATTGEAATPQREVCVQLRCRLQAVLRCMGGGWPAALPPAPRWPPTEAEAAAQAASDDMMRLLLEVHFPDSRATSCGAHRESTCIGRLPVRIATTCFEETPAGL